MKNYQLVSLQFITTLNYEKNLQKLLILIKQTPQKSLIVAPEVCLTGYDYENFEEVLAFTLYAKEKIKEVSQDKIIVLTLIEKTEDGIFNFVYLFHNKEVIYKRPKVRLFKFGDEHKYMQEGSDKTLKIIEIDGIKIAFFICFELRFKELWKASEGADVIVVPSYWGVLRKEHFRAFTQTLALMNQCYVVASDSANDECTKLSGIITPFGEEFRNQEKEILALPYKPKEIKKMRRYMDIGL